MTKLPEAIALDQASTTHSSPAATCCCIQIASLSYGKALKLQRSLVEARNTGKFDQDVVLVLEHPSVFTLGRRGGRENLIVSETFLRQRGIQIVPVERGGNITYHGPGQLVAYPILRLKRFGLRVVEYVRTLEQLMIAIAADWGLTATAHSQKRGVWIGQCKLGSIGITIRRGITFHGLALNVNVDLEPFDWINPCGLADVKMTSMAGELAVSVPMASLRQSFERHFAALFGIALTPTTLDALEAELAPGWVHRSHS